jgi:hypothetical protein
MALKTYLFDKSYQRTYLSPRHEVKFDDGYKTYRLIEGDTELELKKQGTRKVTEMRIFVGSQLYSTDNVTVQKFIESKPKFGDKIKIYDPVAENKAKADEATSDLRIMLEVTDLEQPELLSLAWNLFGRDAVVKAKEGDYSGIKLDVLAHTQKNPAEVKELLTDKTKNQKFEIGLAIAQGVIEDNATEVVWAHNGSKIVSIPRDLTAVQAMVDLYKQNEGREVRKLVQTMMKEKGAKKTETKTPEPEAPAK